ncbi:MAG: 4Fe-4S dicluster domain-containing protein [Deltaproteobacteria bacterium]|nr:4Fe-4S dicluster domain-containing protein [Deltaproteobacteria bacterium]
MVTGRILENLITTPRGLTVAPSRCLRMRYAESGCGRCAAVCPASAIGLEGGLELLERNCTGCLVCSAVCPSGALEAQADFSRLIAALAAHRFPALVVGCGKSGASLHQRLPCLGMLSGEHLLALYAAGGAIVQLDAVGCGGCPAGSMLAGLEARLRETGESCGLPLGERVRVVTDSREIDFREEALDRRGFFQSFRKLAFQGIATALAPSPPERQTLSYMDKSLPVRRGLLNAAIASLPAESASAAGKAFSFSIDFGAACDGCLGCVRACPTEALAEPDGDSPETRPPLFDPERCTGCGLCAEFCLSGAIRLEPPLS